MPDSIYRPHIVITNEPAPAVKREYEGGGGGTYPRTSYQIHANKIYKEVDQLKAIFSKVADSESSKLYYKISLPDGHKVSTSQGKILEANVRSSIVGSPKENIAHVSTSKESFVDLAEELKKYQDTDTNTGKSKFALIEEMAPIPFEEKASERFLANFNSDEEEGEALVTIFPDLNEKDLGIILKGIQGFLDSKAGELLSVTPGEEGAVLKVKSKKRILEELATTFISIQSLDSADELLDVMATTGESVSDHVIVKPNTSNAFVGIFDTGINQNSRYLQGSILASEHPFGDNKGVGTSHGTLVASRVIYGDSIKDQVTTGTLTPDVRILNVCFNKFDAIGNPQKATIDELISIIRNTVEKWHKQIRVYNLSLSCVSQKPGVSSSIKDDVVHPLASEIDALSRKYDVLFVVCTGNYPLPSQQNPASAYPAYFSVEDCRIMSPAESMLALTVGSVANEEASGSMAKKGEPSPFTRKGPGFSGYYKPDLAAHGGNCGSNWSSHSFLEAVGFCHQSDSIAYSRGTSFSTPIISRLAAKIFEIIPTASACLVKAMLIHFSSKAQSPNFSSEDLDKLIGNGNPLPDMLANSSKHMQTYLYQGEVDYRDIIEVPFHVPAALVNRTVDKKLRIRVTISFYPETSRVLKSGYCKSHIRTKIIKRNAKGEEKDVPFSSATVIDSDRYSTVIKMEKEFSREISSGDWKVLVAHESRWNLKNPKTKFAIVITVEDPKNDPVIDIYQAIRNEVPNRYKQELKINERIRI